MRAGFKSRIINVSFILQCKCSPYATVTTVCILFLVKQKWPRNKSVYDVPLLIYLILLFTVSSVPVTEKKISNIGPTNLSRVIDIENKLSPLQDKELQKSVRSSEDKLRKQDKDKRRLEMEKRKEERKKELERRRLERDREKAARQSSPKRLIDLVAVPDVESDHEEFKPWEDVDEAQSSPGSDVTVSELAWVRKSFSKKWFSCLFVFQFQVPISLFERIHSKKIVRVF